jgi:hypothetical protein
MQADDESVVAHLLFPPTCIFHPRLVFLLSIFSIHLTSHIRVRPLTSLVGDNGEYDMAFNKESDDLIFR